MHRPTIIKLGLHVQWYKKNKKGSVSQWKPSGGDERYGDGDEGNGDGGGNGDGDETVGMGWDGDNVHPRVTPEVS